MLHKFKRMPAFLNKLYETSGFHHEPVVKRASHSDSYPGYVSNQVAVPPGTFPNSAPCLNFASLSLLLCVPSGEERDAHNSRNRIRKG
uniref:Uncharacterized protein n=1 Tax=Anguilla anguilla TaxID=7936 RepID=A0A0E9WT45_ANGAN